MIFIVGVGRSGTSMLQSMLDSHSQIAFLPETQFVRHYLCSDSVVSSIESKGIQSFIERTDDDENLMKDPDLKRAWNSSLLQEQALDLAAAFKSLVSIQLSSTEKEIGGEKDAGNIDFLKRIKKFFPESKIILIYRDPREVVLSKTKASWSSGRPYWQHSLIGSAQLKWGIELGTKIFGRNFRKVKYEDLLGNSKVELEKICSFLGISYEDGMMDFYKKAPRLFVAKRELQFKSNNFKPLIKNNNDKWRTELSRRQIRFIESTNHRHISRLLYERDEESRSTLVTTMQGWISDLFVAVYPILIRIKSSLRK